MNLVSLWDRMWYNRQGKLVIWQWPNVWLIAWAVLTMGSLLTSGRTSDICYWVGSATLLIWSFLEIFRGANYFRRLLGVLVLVLAVASGINVLH